MNVTGVQTCALPIYEKWIYSSSENKELYMNYLCKISGSMIYNMNYNKEKKRQELRHWLYNYMKNFT